MASIEQRLAGHKVIGLDTSVFIYHLESHPRYQPLTRVILSAVQSGQLQGVTTVVTLMELTVRPWQLNQAQVARQYEVLLVNFPNLTLFDVNRDVVRRAAQLRASDKLRPADALQVATALEYGATVFVTNDKQLKRLTSYLDVIVLEEFA